MESIIFLRCLFLKVPPAQVQTQKTHRNRMDGPSLKAHFGKTTASNWISVAKYEKAGRCYVPSLIAFNRAIDLVCIA
jgi:hypothetical protein